MLVRRCLVVVALAGGACHAQPMEAVGLSTVRAAPSTIVDAAAQVPSPVAADFREHMTRMAPRQVSEGHAEKFDAIVWANDAARAAWDSRGDMPDGAVLVEEAIQRASQGDKAAGLLTMEKQGGAWRFASVGPAGEVADDARVARCASCHADAPRDDVFRLGEQAPRDAQASQ